MRGRILGERKSLDSMHFLIYMLLYMKTAGNHSQGNEIKILQSRIKRWSMQPTAVIIMKSITSRTWTSTELFDEYRKLGGNTLSRKSLIEKSEKGTLKSISWEHHCFRARSVKSHVFSPNFQLRLRSFFKEISSWLCFALLYTSALSAFVYPE